MNDEFLKYLILEDCKRLIEKDGFKPSVAEQVVYIRFFNGVYDNMILSN